MAMSAKKRPAKGVTPRGPARLSYGYPLSKQSVEANQRVRDVKGQERQAMAAAKKQVADKKAAAMASKKRGKSAPTNSQMAKRASSSPAGQAALLMRGAKKKGK